MDKYSNRPDPCQPKPRAKVDSPVDQWLQRAWDVFFPPRCVLCLDPGQRPGLDLCEGCQADLPWIRAACADCGLPLPDDSPAATRCGECQQRLKAFDRTVALLRYEFPVDSLIRGLKYHGQLPHARVLGTLLGQRLVRDGVPPVQALVPVPLHRVREARRGYNQAYEIARFVERQTGIPVRADACRRVRATVEQTALDARERRRNLRAAFEHGSHVPRRVAIIDDVMTTGSTLEEVARTLRRGGAEWIEAWVIARAG